MGHLKKRLKFNLLNKKGDLKRILMILVVGLLLFFVVNGILSFGETTNEVRSWKLEVQSKLKVGKLEDDTLNSKTSNLLRTLNFEPRTLDNLFRILPSVYALTPEEEKQQLEAELAQLEAQLNVISAGFGQDFGGLLCGVDKIKYNNYNCDNILSPIAKYLASRYFKKYSELRKSGRYYKIVEDKELKYSEQDLKIDFEIIAIASLKGVDVVVSADKRTMLSSLATETYNIINKINSLRTPKLIDYFEFRKRYLK